MADRTRILIVEDEGLVAKDLERALTKMGYEPVGIAFTGPDAISLVEQNKPDLVFMDIRLRGPMDGIQAAAAIRDRFSIPVVYLTAHADIDTVRRAAITQPHGYVLKPFDEKAIRPAVEMALYRHKVEQPIEDMKRRLDLQTAELSALWKLIESRFDKEVALSETTSRLRAALTAHIDAIKGVMDQLEHELGQAQSGLRSRGS